MINVRRIKSCDLPLPSRGTEEAAGLDLAANRTVFIQPGEQYVMGTGFCFELPLGTVGLIWQRSSMAKKQIDTRAGVIDSDYRGEVKVVLRNESKKQVCITKGERIAQMLVQPVSLHDCQEVETLNDTRRGDGGFGSTGE